MQDSELGHRRWHSTTGSLLQAGFALLRDRRRRTANRQDSRPRPGWQVALLIACLLTSHWTAMHLIARYSQIECNTAIAQDSRNRASHQVTIESDRWRYTTNGWEILPDANEEARQFATPSAHYSLAQTWPAAWAACVAITIVALVALVEQ